MPGDGYSNGHMITIGDFDGDGKSDIWHSLDLTTSSSNHVIYYSNGVSFSTEINGFTQSTNSEQMYSSGDFNGDGKPDLLKVRKVNNENFPVKFVLTKSFKEKNLLVNVSNLGYLIKFDYALLNGKDNYSPSVYTRTEGDYSCNDGASSTPCFPNYIVSALAM